MNIVILTPLALEHDAVKGHLKNLKEEIIGFNSYLIGQFSGKYHSYNIITQQTGARNSVMALAAIQAIKKFKPFAILLVGVAGGVKDVEIGDIVVGTKVYDYESGKELSEGFAVRPVVFNFNKTF